MACVCTGKQMPMPMSAIWLRMPIYVAQGYTHLHIVHQVGPVLRHLRDRRVRWRVAPLLERRVELGKTLPCLVKQLLLGREGVSVQ